jgi:cell division septation protein DedD
MQAITPLAEGLLPRMRFQPSESRDWIHVRGRTAWVAESKKLAGIEFVGLSDEARGEIRQLLSSPSHVSQLPEKAQRLVLLEQDFGTSADMDSLVATHPSPQTQSGISARRNLLHPPYVLSETSPPPAGSARRWLSAALVALLVLTLLAIWAGKNGTANKRIREADSLGKIAAPQSETVQGEHGVSQPLPHPGARPEPTSSVPSPGSPPTISPPTGDVSGGSGFGLQVAAMIHKENADALVRSLHAKNVPVRILKRASDPFYRVVVGPYGDRRLADGAISKLETWGFKPIRVRWKP